MTDIDDQDDEHSSTPRDELEPQIEAMSEDLGELSLHMREISAWHGLSTVGFVFDPPLAWGFRSGGDEQLVAAELEFPVDHEKLPFEPCDKQRWHELAGRDRPMPTRPS